MLFSPDVHVLLPPSLPPSLPSFLTNHITAIKEGVICLTLDRGKVGNVGLRQSLHHGGRDPLVSHQHLIPLIVRGRVERHLLPERLEVIHLRSSSSSSPSSIRATAPSSPPASPSTSVRVQGGRTSTTTTLLLLLLLLVRGLSCRGRRRGKGTEEGGQGTSARAGGRGKEGGRGGNGGTTQAQHASSKGLSGGGEEEKGGSGGGGAEDEEGRSRTTTSSAAAAAASGVRRLLLVGGHLHLKGASTRKQAIEEGRRHKKKSGVESGSCFWWLGATYSMCCDCCELRVEGGNGQATVWRPCCFWLTSGKKKKERLAAADAAVGCCESSTCAVCVVVGVEGERDECLLCSARVLQSHGHPATPRTPEGQGARVKVLIGL